MMRFGMALALALCVLAILYVAPVLRQAAHQIGGHDVAPARDHEFNLVHAEGR